MFSEGNFFTAQRSLWSAVFFPSFYQIESNYRTLCDTKYSQNTEHARKKKIDTVDLIEHRAF